MQAKLLILFLGWIALGGFSIDLATIREAYRAAYENEEVVEKLHDDLTAVGMQDDAVLVAYKGAVTTMLAGYSEGFQNKKMLFREGRELVEHAVETRPENVEIRCIRLSVQENVPKITGYTKNQEEDKQFILDHFDSIEDPGAKAFIKGFATQSGSFTEAERQSF